MISRRTSSIPKEEVVVVQRLLCCDSRCLQTCRWRSQVPWSLSSALPGALRLVVGPPRHVASAPRCSQVHPKFSLALRGVLKPIPITPVAVIRDPRYSEGRPEYPPRVWYSPEFDASKFTLHILTDTPGVFEWLEYILLRSMLVMLVISLLFLLLLLQGTGWLLLGMAVPPIGRTAENHILASVAATTRSRRYKELSGCSIRSSRTQWKKSSSKLPWSLWGCTKRWVRTR